MVRGETGNDDPQPRDVIAAVTRWLEQAIIGMQLCPFAAKPWREGKVRIAVGAGRDAEEAVRDVLDEAFQLLEPEPDVPPPEPGPVRPETTLLALPHADLDFETLLDVAATAEAILEEAGAAGMLQVITFHPDYRFEGEAEDEPGAYTNRSPVALVHLLREDEVSAAVEQHPDTLAIPERNVAHLRALGLARIRELWAAFEPGSTTPGAAL
jgi:hypothetical protein